MKKFFFRLFIFLSLLAVGRYFLWKMMRSHVETTVLDSCKGDRRCVAQSKAMFKTMDQCFTLDQVREIVKGQDRFVQGIQQCVQKKGLVPDLKANDLKP